jgi:hypothetical protein
MVAGCVPYIFKVIVLSTGPDALLDRSHPGSSRGTAPCKYILERHHPGIDEKKRGIVLGYNRS